MPCNYLADILPHSTAAPSTSVVVAICTLPEELTPEWDKQPLGNQVVTNIARLLEFGNEWQCKSHLYLIDSCADNMLGNVAGLSVGPATLSIKCKTCNVLVSTILQFSLQMIKYVL